MQFIRNSVPPVPDSTGAVTDSYDFDAYGRMVRSEKLTATGTEIGNDNPNHTKPAATDLLYSGEQFDSDLQMQYLRARYYDQNNGRFNSVDPFSGNRYDPQSLHKYGYAHSDPVNGTDPSGNTTMIEALSVVAIQNILFIMIGGAIANKISGGLLFEGLRMTFDFLMEPLTWIIAAVNIVIGLYSMFSLSALGQMLGMLLINILTGGVMSLFLNIYKAIESVFKAATGLKQAFSIEGQTQAQFRLLITSMAFALAVTVATVLLGLIMATIVTIAMQLIGPVISRMLTFMGKKARRGARNMACCFVAGTKVKTNSGWKSIEKVKENDKVWSRNDKTGESGYKRVLQLFVTAPEKLVTMSYCRAKRTGGKSNVKNAGSSDDEDGSGSITGTLTHPVWSETRQAWIDLGKLKVGEKLKLDDGTQTVVTTLKFKTAPKGSKFTTYNFEVADWHTYFVAPTNAKATTKAVWVHNTGNPCGKRGKPMRRQGDGEHGHHSFPKFMGGDSNQKLTNMRPQQHRALHRDMNNFLRKKTDKYGNHMRPQRGNSGRKIRKKFTPEQRTGALKQFYTEYIHKYPEASRAFFSQIN